MRAERADVVCRVVRVIGADERFRILGLGGHFVDIGCEGGSKLSEAMTRCCSFETPRGSTAGSRLVRHCSYSHANFHHQWYLVMGYILSSDNMIARSARSAIEGNVGRCE